MVLHLCCALYQDTLGLEDVSILRMLWLREEQQQQHHGGPLW